MGAWSAGSIGVSGDGASPFRSAAAQADLAVDAVRHGRLKFFTLPGSGIVAPPRTAAPASSGRKFWQLGVQSAGLPRRPGSVTPSSQGGEAALQPHKSLASLLFGRSRRGSYAGGGGSSTPASPGSARWAAQLDPAASWRSSFDGGSSGAHALSRRGSARRSSDSSVLRSSLAHLPQAAAAAAGAAARQDGGVWASLASGEGPLSKSHALLAKPGPGTDAVGRSLECVAEDEREGRGERQQRMRQRMRQRQECSWTPSGMGSAWMQSLIAGCPHPCCCRLARAWCLGVRRRRRAGWAAVHHAVSATAHQGADVSSSSRWRQRCSSQPRAEQHLLQPARRQAGTFLRTCMCCCEGLLCACTHAH